MHWFLKLFIYPLLDAISPRVVVEVGVAQGTVTAPLLRWAREHDAVLHSIDPDPALNVDRLLSEYEESLRFHRATSLEVLGEIEGVDLALIDGDHNWYTVINELRALEGRAREDAREPPVILLHDVGWPYGRRDLYYEPQAIPEAHRQPHARGGLLPGRVELGPGMNEHFENALLEGTPANGVLSAVEDFLAESSTQWRMWSIPGLSGLAILVSSGVLEANASLRELLDSIDTPTFLRAHCEAIEQARITSDCRRANVLRRLAETQLKQITRSDDPHETIALYRRVRELSEQVRDLEGRLERVDELEEQIRLLTLAPPDPPVAVEATDVGGEGEGEGSAFSAPEPDSEPEREAWRTLLDLYLPVLEQALPCKDGRDPLSPPCPLDVRGMLCAEGEEQEPGRPSVDVVVCVHDALEELRLCLWSLLAKSGRRLRLILVDDGSDEATARFVRAFADRHPAVTLIHREPPHGYTLAANRGLEASSGDYVVLLNSDTVLSAGWLDRVLDYGEAHPEVGVLGPLSNAATHQSVPHAKDGGAWAVNTLPDWLTVDGMGLLLTRGAPHSDIRLPFLNGFCYILKRAVIDAIGQFDEERFATGYCEENDYSHRAREAGFELAVLDDVYVYHAKSRSFGADGRAELARRNYESFLEKHGREEIEALVSAIEADRSLEPVRAAVAELTASPEAIAPLLGGGDGGAAGVRGDRPASSAGVRGDRPAPSDGAAPGRPDESGGPNGAALSIVFLLPGLAHGGSGGAHSIYQEVHGLRGLGIPARIMLPQWDSARAAAVYEDAAEVFQTFLDEDDLAAKTADANVISATHHKSVALLEAIRARRSDFLPAYYVQDYEPFFTVPYIAQEAIASYTALPDMLLFAKSHWLCNVVAERHGLYVAKVEPSIDREVFFPAAPAGAHEAGIGGADPGHAGTSVASPNGSGGAGRAEPGVLRVAAMLRPRTARRQPLATVAVLERLLEELPGQVRVTTFGCYADELREILPGAEQGVLERHRGMLSRSEVAGLLRESDVFLDMSVYQAFGRTALEAMACGATAVLPNLGGAWEFVEHGGNALAVDTLEPEGALAALRALAADAELLSRLKAGALRTAARHSIARAALSEYLLFERAHAERFGEPAGHAAAASH
jgi:GT2 family glycosyltransferase/glycosyltransferase involved in cell wall biosynthesis